MEKITPKDHPEQFAELCKELKIEHLSTVHHFEKDALGLYRPVFWEDIKQTPYKRNEQ